MKSNCCYPFQDFADVWLPKGITLKEALKRTTHLGVGAHADDLEIMAFHGIAECYEKRNLWFTGVVCTDGVGHPQSENGLPQSLDEVRIRRRNEQRKAARLGKYSTMIQLGYSSASLKQRQSQNLHADLAWILESSQPEIVYTHNILDKHSTHVAVCEILIEVARDLRSKWIPRQVLGCEVWRSLDWVPDDLKIALDVSGHRILAKKLLEVFSSQIKDGKRYDLATLGRRKANATYFQPRSVDRAKDIIYAIDLISMIDGKKNPRTFVSDLIDAFKKEALKILSK